MDESQQGQRHLPGYAQQPTAAPAQGMHVTPPPTPGAPQGPPPPQGPLETHSAFGQQPMNVYQAMGQPIGQPPPPEMMRQPPANQYAPQGAPPIAPAQPQTPRATMPVRQGSSSMAAGGQQMHPRMQEAQPEAPPGEFYPEAPVHSPFQTREQQLGLPQPQTPQPQTPQLPGYQYGMQEPQQPQLPGYSPPPAEPAGLSDRERMIQAEAQAAAYKELIENGRIAPTDEPQEPQGPQFPEYDPPPMPELGMAMPVNYSEEAAATDPHSESAKYKARTVAWQREMVEYNQRLARYDTAYKQDQVKAMQDWQKKNDAKIMQIAQQRERAVQIEAAQAQLRQDLQYKYGLNHIEVGQFMTWIQDTKNLESVPVWVAAFRASQPPPQQQQHIGYPTLPPPQSYPQAPAANGQTNPQMPQQPPLQQRYPNGVASVPGAPLAPGVTPVDEFQNYLNHMPATGQQKISIWNADPSRIPVA